MKLGEVLAGFISLVTFLMAAITMNVAILEPATMDIDVCKNITFWLILTTVASWAIVGWNE